MAKAPPTLTNPDPGVMATRPATAPLAAPMILGLPVQIQLIPIQLNAAIAAAVLVTTKALVARVPAMTALPALNPNQPNHRNDAPRTMYVVSCAPTCFLL